MDTEVSEGFEYLDHTADVQLHSWGESLKASFEQVAKAMFGYMTDLEKIVERSTMEVEADGDDLNSLLYNFLTNWLSDSIICNYFIAKRIVIEELDLESFHIKSVGHGEPFDRTVHEQGTEVKAITYSAMQIHQEESSNDIYVIIDI